MVESRDILFETYKDRVWKSPSDYSGHDPVGEMIVAARTRDSGFLDNYNYSAIKERLQDVLHSLGRPSLQDNNLVYEWSARHWAVGWIRYLMVSPNAPGEVHDEVISILEELENGSVIDLDNYVVRYEEYAKEVWDSLDDYDKEEIFEEIKTNNPDSDPHELECLAREYVKEIYLLE